MQKIVLFLIKVYQKTISLDQGFFSKIYQKPLCRFYPTCSEYTFQVIKKFGIKKGVWLGVKRIFKCHPWHKGGIDNIPIK